MRLFAFEGLHYTPRAGDAGELAAQPYDQINDALRDRYHALSPFQFVHLTRPVAEHGSDPYESAKALHGEWLEERVIAREPKPALYPYAIELVDGGRRLGLCGLVGLADAKVIRPHEQTLDKPLADRLALLEAMRVDLEPALILSEDGGTLDALLEEDLRGAQPLVRHRDGDGHVHVLYRIDGPERIARYQAALDVPAAIADGHHRYKVAQRFAETHRAERGTAAATKLAVVTSLDSPSLTIDPIHRAFKEPIELWRLGGPRLVVEIFQSTFLSALGLPPEASTNGTVVYRANPGELWNQVASGELGTGIFLPPMRPAEFAAAIADGEMLPAKSTRFLPKVMSGLVWADHESKIL